MSFSEPLPAKSPRTPLRRTGSYLSLADMQAASEYNYELTGSPNPSRGLAGCPSLVPYNRTLRFYKEQRDRRRAAVPRSSCAGLTITVTYPSPPSPAPPPKPAQSSRLQPPRPRTSSPLAPTRSALPARASFPRSKPEPDLYRVAITTRMRMSTEGQKVLHMGPRLAMSIQAATNELERLVAAQDADVVMADAEPAPLSNSWIVVPQEDWEMVDCSA